MSYKVRKIPLDTDILIAHCPPYGFLDVGIVDRFGNIILTNHFTYSVDEKNVPKYILCGHIHECGGFRVNFISDKEVINSATTYTLIEV